jgi:transcriptional regulator with PAS, ATPase and Fis domain
MTTTSRDQTLPISETGDESALASLPCLILIGQSHRPVLPLAQIVSLEGLTSLRLGRGDETSFRPEGTTLAITLDDRWISSEHAVVKCFPMGERTWCVLEDLDSTNGCRVNGEPVKRRQLQHADLIETGHTFWQFHERCERDLASLLEIAHRAGEAVTPTSSVSPAMLRQLRQMTRVAPSEIPVILLGESGTGKEVMKTALHEQSGRRGALVAINCAAIPSTLIESELFGHRKGAFTGAYADKRGVVEAAAGGTLFLDEIGDLPLDVQAKLLRLLQERSFLRVGDTTVRTVDVRFVAATNRDLEEMVRLGTFRGDLFARLNGISLELPPLRERREDIGLLLSVFLGRSAVPRELSLEAYRALLTHGWPYNIRELEKSMTASMTLADESPAIRLEHLPSAVQGAAPKPRRAEAEGHAPEPDVQSGEDVAEEEAGGGGGRRFSDQTELRAVLVGALSTHGGNVAAVARELGTSRAQVHRLMQRAGLEPDSFRRSKG